MSTAAYTSDSGETWICFEIAVWLSIRRRLVLARESYALGWWGHTDWLRGSTKR